MFASDLEFYYGMPAMPVRKHGECRRTITSTTPLDFRRKTPTRSEASGRSLFADLELHIKDLDAC